jgi:hypothetical protein
MSYVLAGFDKETDLIADRVDVTALGSKFLAELIGVPEDDLVYDNPLSGNQLRVLCEATGFTPDTARREYFVIAEADR